MFNLLKNVFTRPVESNKPEELESDGIKIIPYDAYIFQILSKELESAKQVKNWCMDECYGGCNRTSCTWCLNGKQLIEAQAQIGECQKKIAQLLFVG